LKILWYYLLLSTGRSRGKQKISTGIPQNTGLKKSSQYYTLGVWDALPKSDDINAISVRPNSSFFFGRPYGNGTKKKPNAKCKYKYTTRGKMQKCQYKYT